MITFTFDTNCLIDLSEEREAANYIWELIEGHRKNDVSVAFIAVSASERQKGDYFLPTYGDFLGRLKAVGVEDIPQIFGILYQDISYWDAAIWGSEESDKLEREIHKVLFPNLPFALDDYAVSLSKTVDGLSAKQHFKWRNAWCDRQMIWSHIHHQRHVFVTGDRNFRKIQKCARFEGCVVATPKEAISMV
ncbi:hypothetical protein HKX54_03730 [Sulfitobacter sp. M57]|uniref:hypothetical protein n=1 Tax=unclassified Sulfitobacter TaxID=196795 RepID=UPI0023E23740|nr:MULTISPECIES: hypothetical protein [unclassified Sulfitobacter]MDF3413555.1 hypothetical protein [Sulfitobacter sp. KE5]MDF3421163.1 hypothetical protein [Sulfitobacter sp. KE43]MDF3432102.1 hypothetical protein [Sulfitobacter sp. KE42]MDF3457742.1 hypothetical protein [Sulfitobacter sp. S74]MDF3461643.1 hypothetical protein [Sulfitobacter sp. Ks18]